MAKIKYMNSPERAEFTHKQPFQGCNLLHSIFPALREGLFKLNSFRILMHRNYVPYHKKLEVVCLKYYPISFFQ